MVAHKDGVRTAIKRELAKRALYARSLHEFVKAAWHIVEPTEPFIDGKHIEAICEHLQAVSDGRIRRLAILIPPRHSKSLIVAVLWPVWDSIRNPWRRWLFATYAFNLTARDARRRRTLVESEWFQTRWGHQLTLDRSVRSLLRMANTAGGEMLSTSVGSQLTGEGGHIIVVDDPHNATEVESQAKRDKVNLNWWGGAMSTRHNNPKVGAFVIIMQRLHEDDLVGHIFRGAEDGEWDVLCLPARFDPAHPTPSKTKLGFEDWRTEPGELLCPQRFGEPELRYIEKQLGPRAAAAQLQQRPAPAGGAVFKQEWFRYWSPGWGQQAEHYARLGDREPVDWTRGVKYLTCDPALSETEEASTAYSVVCAWSDVKLPNGERHLILLDMFRDRVDTPELADAVIAMRKKWGAGFVWCERDGVGLAAIKALKRRQVPIKEISARLTGSKDGRAYGAQFRFAANEVWFPAGAEWLQDLEAELTTYPASKYKDQVDCISYGVLVAEGRVKSGKPVRVGVA